jgi:hypothetical protein
MDRSSVIFIVMPIVIPLVVFAGASPCRISLTVVREKGRDMHTTFAARQGSGPVNARPQVVIVGAGFAGLRVRRRASECMAARRSPLATSNPAL